MCEATYSSVISLKFKGKVVNVECLVADLFPDCELLIGLDVVLALGGVNIDSFGKVCLINQPLCNVSLSADNCIEDDDFSANFVDGKWKWSMKK